MKKIIKKSGKYVLFSFFLAFVKIGFHLGSAFILSLYTQPLSKNRRYRVLVLRKPTFISDIYSISKYSNKIDFLLFPREFLLEYIKKHIPFGHAATPEHHGKPWDPNPSASLIGNLTDSKYHLIMDGTVEKEKIYNSLSKVFLYLQKFIRFDAIISGNYVYRSQQELARVAGAQRVPFIVLYKEGMYPPLSKKMSDIFFSNKRFIGDRILFYNNSIRESLLDAKIKGLKRKNTTVVGIPRFDKYFGKKENPIDSKIITLFAFKPEVKAEFLVEDPRKAEAYIKRCKSFQSFFVKFCLKNPDYKLIIKLKSNQKHLEGNFMKIIEEHGISSIPDNIKITSFGNPFDLIKSSSFTAGFVSTTLLEAIILDTPVICPYMRDIITDGTIDYFDNHPQAINYIKTYGSLEKLILNNSYNIPNKLSKQEILEPFMYSTDGQSCKRAEKEIINCIKSYK